MERKVWRAFPEELFGKVLARLPVKDLLPLRRVCKAWNSIQFDSSFQEARGSWSREFLDEVLRCLQLHGAYFTCFSGDFLLVVDVNDDIYIVRPSELIFSQVPRLDAKNHKDFDKRYVIGMVVHQEAKCFDIFVATHRILGESESVDVHKYDSSTDTWSLYGKEDFHSRFKRWGLGTFDLLCEFAGVVFHDNHYLMVVSKVDPLKHLFGNIEYEIKYRYFENDLKWKPLRGELPPAGKMAPLLFDYKGRLMLASLCGRKCSLWEYEDDKFEWNLVHQFFIYDTHNTGLVESAELENLPRYVDIYFPYANYHYAHVVGDFLYFGHAYFGAEASDRSDYRMKYSLITRELDPVSLDEDEVKKMFVECKPRPRECYEVKRMFKRGRDHRLLFCLLDTASVVTSDSSFTSA